MGTLAELPWCFQDHLFTGKSTETPCKHFESPIRNAVVGTMVATWKYRNTMEHHIIGVHGSLMETFMGSMDVPCEEPRFRGNSMETPWNRDGSKVLL